MVILDLARIREGNGRGSILSVWPAVIRSAKAQERPAYSGRRYPSEKGLFNFWSRLRRITHTSGLDSGRLATPDTRQALTIRIFPTPIGTHAEMGLRLVSRDSRVLDFWDSYTLYIGILCAPKRCTHGYICKSLYIVYAIPSPEQKANIP